MKKLIISKLTALVQQRVSNLKAQKKAIVDSVSVEVADTVELTSDVENVWSVKTPDGRPTNTLHVKDERQALVLTANLLGQKFVAKTEITAGSDGRTFAFSPTVINRGATAVFGGVTMKNYRRLKKVTNKIRFWEKIGVKLLSL